MPPAKKAAPKKSGLKPPSRRAAGASSSNVAAAASASAPASAGPAASQDSSSGVEGAQKAIAHSQLVAAMAANMKRVVDVFRELDRDKSGEVDKLEFRRGIRMTLGDDFADVRKTHCPTPTPHSTALSGPIL